jgi:cytochrome c553
MKKITLLSLATAALLFTAGAEDSKNAAADATAKTTKVAKETTADVKEAASDLAEATKEKAAELAAAAKVEADKVTKNAVEAAEALKAKAVATTETAKEMAKEVLSDDAEGKAAYAKCAGCHGKDGKTKALGKSEVIAGQAADDLEKKLSEYKAGTRNVSGMGTLMKGQVASMSDDAIEAVSEYISEM